MLKLPVYQRNANSNHNEYHFIHFISIRGYESSIGKGISEVSLSPHGMSE
jgi:hypothetical protein